MYEILQGLIRQGSPLAARGEGEGAQLNARKIPRRESKPNL